MTALSTTIARMVMTMHRRENGICFWCGFLTALTPARAESFAVMDPEGRRPHAGDMHRCRLMTRATFDHFKPRSKGGHSSLNNGKLSCRWCNQWRGDEEAPFFRIRIDRLVAAGQHPRQLYRANGKWPAAFPKKESFVL